MGKKSVIQIVLLIGMFGVTSVIIHLKASMLSSSGMDLDKIDFQIDGGWTLNAEASFNSIITQALALDDYVNLIYSKNGRNITLYVGYYGSLTKVGAAHSPLVCVPGQGWAIINTDSVIFSVGDKKIDAHAIQAEKNGQKRLIVYWYQVYDKTFSGTLKQKLYGFFAKTFYGNEKNAFVQITSAINTDAEENTFELTRDFLNHFYPRFFLFMTS